MKFKTLVDSKYCKITAAMSSIYFHVTEKKNWTKIKTQGLKPQIGDLAKQLDEPVPAIYLFTSEDDADNAVCQWLGDAYEEIAEERGTKPEGIDLVMLKVEVPDTFNCQKPKTGEFEVLCYEKIPAKYIIFYKDC